MKSEGIKLMKKVVLLVIFLGLALSTTAPANATPITKPNVLNNLYLNEVENWLDEDNSGAISSGDLFYGIVNVQEIKSPPGTTIWNMDNVPPGLDTLTGYFLTKVTSVVPVSGTTYRIDLGPSTVDLNGVFDSADLAAGVVMKLWEDSSTAYTAAASSVTADIARATDGTPWGSLTLGVDGDSTYWYTKASLIPPDTASIIGDTWFGLNFLPGTGTHPAVYKIDDPSIEEGAGGKAFVDIYGTANVNVADSDIQANGWKFTGNDPATIKPVPEPASMLLFGIGMLGSIAALRRKKKIR